MTRTLRRTRIVCTFGPATASEERIKELANCGMDVARLNFSHGEHADHAANFDRVRKAADDTGRTIGIMADLQGPKIRLGRFAEGSTIWNVGEEVRITVEPCIGTHDRVSTTYDQLADDAKAGDRFLIDDGRIALDVIAIEGPDVVCRVVVGGPVSDNKGLSLPGVNVSVPALSAKDIADLEFALELGVDFVALSFVRSPHDIEPVHRVMDRLGRRVPVIAKLEKPEAVDHLKEIVAAFDAVMVARGDLGVELPLEQVPLVQKDAIQLARESAKPVIVATQMLDSMIENARPTRAEASDVAKAVLDGADAVMLSGETSVGKYVFDTVSTMDRDDHGRRRPFDVCATAHAGTAYEAGRYRLSRIGRGRTFGRGSDRRVHAVGRYGPAVGAAAHGSTVARVHSAPRRAAATVTDLGDRNVPRRSSRVDGRHGLPGRPSTAGTRPFRAWRHRRHRRRFAAQHGRVDESSSYSPARRKRPVASAAQSAGLWRHPSRTVSAGCWSIEM